MAFSDEPVLVRPARRPRGRWLAIGGVALLLASVAYVPWEKHHLDNLAHQAKRGPHSGAIYPVDISGQAYQIELGWVRGPVYAIGLEPPPPPSSTLRLHDRTGEETLTWNNELKAFGPGTTPADPYGHHQLTLTLLDANHHPLWTNTLRAFAIIPENGH